jgi:hypothetical protein
VKASSNENENNQMKAKINESGEKNGGEKRKWQSRQWRMQWRISEMYRRHKTM